MRAQELTKLVLTIVVLPFVRKLKPCLEDCIAQRCCPGGAVARKLMVIRRPVAVLAFERMREECRLRVVACAEVGRQERMEPEQLMCP